MAEAHPTIAVATEAQLGRGSIPNPWQGDLDALKEEIRDLKTMLGSVVKEIKELKQVKVESAALGVPKFEVKSEPPEVTFGVDSEETPAPADLGDDFDHEQMEVTREEQERIDVDDEPEGASQGTDEQIPGGPPRRQSTEEPTWMTPPRGEVLFRVNPEYAQRIARANEVVAPPVRVPAPPPQPLEETAAPLPPPAVHPTRAIGIIPASQAKRKHNFELIIEVPAKRFKLSDRPMQSSSSNGSGASSSRITLDAPAAATTRVVPVKPQRRSSKDIIRKVPGTQFAVTLDPKIRDILVTREFMRSWFGTHYYHQFCEPSVDMVRKHGFDHFVFVNGDSTPQAPTAPGQPGLVTLFDERPWPAYDRYRVFGRVQMSPARWQYLGLYKVTKLPAWTPEEMQRQRWTVKGSWSIAVRGTKWARPILARIMLRKELGREPTENEIDDQVKKIKNKSVEIPPSNTIMEAFESGEEKLYPWKLECEDYEENLQWEIAVTSPSRSRIDS